VQQPGVQSLAGEEAQSGVLDLFGALVEMQTTILPSPLTAQRLLNSLSTETITEKTSQVARDSGRRLAAYVGAGYDLRVRIVEQDQPGEEVVIPKAALPLLSRILGLMAEGHMAVVMRVKAELTTQQAADLLNVSRPYLIKLLEEGHIPHHKVGTHRRIFARDVLDYKAEIDRKRLMALDELAQQAQELQMGYC
jgi:excisionase family DNA binding protein